METNSTPACCLGLRFQAFTRKPLPSAIRGGRPRIKPPIQEVFRRGDEVLVQVIKEGIGTKGPTLSTYISIPGRYLVLMPGLQRVGVSRKITDEGIRRQLRTALEALNPPEGLGFIIRTAGIDKTKAEIQRDFTYLTRLWMMIDKKMRRPPTSITVTCTSVEKISPELLR